jgi:hypothetical protein
MPLTSSRYFGNTVALAGVAFAASLPLIAQTQQHFKVDAQWKIGGDGGWDYLKVDSATHRLYIAHTAQVDAIDLNTGKLAGSVKGLSHTHGVVIAQDGKTGFIYPVLQTLETARGARTMALDESTGKIYTVSAQFGPPKSGQRWPSVLPGTFTIYVIGQD